MEYELCKAAQKLWHDYFLEPTAEGMENILDRCSRNVVMIGPDRKSFHTSAADALENMEDCFPSGASGHPGSSFDILNERYECLCVSPDIYVVYGTLHIREKRSETVSSPLETDSRFSMIYRITASSYEILHIHHSVPCR